MGRGPVPLVLALSLLGLAAGVAHAVAAAAVPGALPPPARSPSAPGASAAGDSTAADPAPFGIPSSHMIGSLLLEQGLAAEAYPYLEYAWRSVPGSRLYTDSYVAALVALLRSGEAIALLNAEIAAQPTDRAPRRRLVALLADDARYDEALQAVAELRRLGDTDPELGLLEGEVLAGAGRVDEAIARLREARERLPERAEALTLRLADLYRQAGRGDDLLALWGEALTAWPASRPVRLNALHDLIAAGRTSRALAVAARGDSLQSVAAAPDLPEDFSWTVEAARLLVQTGHVEEAIPVLEERRRRGELARDETLWLSRLLLHAERWNDALVLLRDVVGRWPDDARGYLYLGEALAARGDVAGAEAQVRRAVKIEPANVEALLTLTRLLTLRAGARPAGAGAPTELAELAARARDLVPADDARGRMILGYAYRTLGEPALAAPQFEAAAALAGVRREALLQLAVCLEDLKRDAEARQTLETLRGEFPDDPTIANSLGYFLAQRGEELARAETLVRDALARQPENPFYVDSLGWVAYRRGDFQAAFDLLVQAANAAPGQPEILEHLGLTLQALGRREEAARVLRQARDAGADPARIDAHLRTLTGPGGAAP
ncbi:MAG: tetratricopeptide repeat protein [Candidatus Krumholzibacteriia bacterium]